MDVSGQTTGQIQERTGTELLEEIITLTGLPAAQIQGEIHRILATTGRDPATLTLEDFREALVAYLADSPELFAD